MGSMLETNNLNLTNNSLNSEIQTPKRTYIPSPFPKSFFDDTTKSDEYVKTQINAKSINDNQHNYLPSPYRQVKVYQVNPQTEYVLQSSQNVINRAISLMNGGF